MSKLAGLCKPSSSLSPSRQQQQLFFTTRSSNAISPICIPVARYCRHDRSRSYITTTPSTSSSTLTSSSYDRCTQSLTNTSRSKPRLRTKSPCMITNTARYFSSTIKSNLDIKIPIYDPDRPANRGWRLAYFGSDHFSQIVLKALNVVKSTEPGLIEYIKVYGLPEGRSGRGMVNERINPVREYVSAEPGPTKMSITMLKNGLIDYDPSIAREDLLIVVSFGHFIPASIIDSFPQGGINVHPSLLPRYRGPAPIMHAIWNKDKFTGVTIQTLDKKKFDHGNILAQSEEIAIDPYILYGQRYPPFPQPGSPYKELSDRLASEGAKLLLEVLRERLRHRNLRTPWGRHVAQVDGEDSIVLERYQKKSSNTLDNWGSPDDDFGQATIPKLEQGSVSVGIKETTQTESPYLPSQAPKLDDRFPLIRIDKESAEDTYRRSLIVPKMFAFATSNDALARGLPPSYMHWFFIGIRIFSNKPQHQELKNLTSGEFTCLWNRKTKEKSMVLMVKEGEYVTVNQIHAEGKTPVDAGEWAFSRERGYTPQYRIRFCTHMEFT